MEEILLKIKSTSQTFDINVAGNAPISQVGRLVIHLQFIFLGERCNSRKTGECWQGTALLDFQRKNSQGPRNSRRLQYVYSINFYNLVYTLKICS